MQAISFVKNNNYSVIIMAKETIYDATLETEILKILAKLHLASYEQMFRLFDDFERADVIDAMNNLIKKDYLIVSDIEIPAPNQYKLNLKKCRKATVKVYTLNCKSRAVLYRNYPHLIRFSRRNPTGLRYKARQYHDLLTVESYLYMRSKHDIVDFFNEEFLQKDRQRMADIQMLVSDCGFIKTINCETVVTNSRSDITRKVVDQWFTYSSYQADIIEELTGQKAVILTVQCDEKVQIDEYYDEHERAEDWELKECFKLTRTGLTGPAVAAIVGRRPERTQSNLAEMERANVLTSNRAHFNIAGAVGSREKIYALNKFDIIERDDRFLALILSKVIVDNAETGYRFGRFIKEKRVVTFVKEENKKLFSLAVYLDNPRNSVLQERYTCHLLAKDPAFTEYQFAFRSAGSDRTNEFLAIKLAVHSVPAS